MWFFLWVYFGSFRFYSGREDRVKEEAPREARVRGFLPSSVPLTVGFPILYAGDPAVVLYVLLVGSISIPGGPAETYLVFMNRGEQ